MLYELDYSMLERHCALRTVLYGYVDSVLLLYDIPRGPLIVVDGRWKSAVNYLNALGTKGNLVHAFSSILHDLWHGEMPYISPFQFRVRTTCLPIQFQGLILTLVLAFHLLACRTVWRFRAARFTGVPQLLA